MIEYLILAAAAFFAGMLNTVAGGGTFLTFPALVYTGVPPLAANAASAVAVFPGYLGGALGFRQEIAAFDRKRLLKVVAFTALGGLAGSPLLLVSSKSLLDGRPLPSRGGHPGLRLRPSHPGMGKPPKRRQTGEPGQSMGSRIHDFETGAGFKKTSVSGDVLPSLVVAVVFLTRV